MLGGGPKESEEGRAEKDAAQKLSDDRRLPHALHELAQEAPDEDEDCDLRQQHKLGGVGGRAGRSGCNGRKCCGEGRR